MSRQGCGVCSVHAPLTEFDSVSSGSSGASEASEGEVNVVSPEHLAPSG
jgi:hypothetical protein